MLTPVLFLVIWTLIIMVWMYARRIPAMHAAGINPNENPHPGALSVLPTPVRAVADNYNHLHEQPTLFYAIAAYSHLVGVDDGLNITLAWSYVGLRVLHSFVQIVMRNVVIRFSLFACSSVVLAVIAGRNLLALFV